jgi:hypothetical protein
MRTEKKQVSDAEEGAPSTNAAAGGQADNMVTTSRDQGRSRVDRQANGCTPTPGEAGNDGMEVDTRSPRGTSDRQEGVFLAPAMVGDATSLTAGGIPNSNEVRRRGVGYPTHVAHIAGLDGDQGLEEEAHITDPGRLRRTGDGSQDELGSGRQR